MAKKLYLDLSLQKEVSTGEENYKLCGQPTSWLNGMEMELENIENGMENIAKLKSSMVDRDGLRDRVQGLRLPEGRHK